MKILTLCLTACLAAAAQLPQNPTQKNVAPVDIGQTPVYRVEVVARTTKAVNYRHRGGATKIDFRGTPLLPEARGEAKVESKQGYIEIEVEFDDLMPASRFGPEFLTYVMWAVTPEGRATNLGEILLNGTKSKLNVTTELQAFGLLVTAEPYFVVTQPSDVVVMENVIRPDTSGGVQEVDAKYELLKRGHYTFNADSTPSSLVTDPKLPLELLEARNAVRISRWAGADRYAGATFEKAEEMLRRAEDHQVRKQGKRQIAMAAREAVQVAEDARLIALQRIEEERLARERQASAEREANAAERAAIAKAQADVEARRRAEAEAASATAQAERQMAERAKREADAAADEARRLREQADRARADAEAAKAQAVAQQQALAVDAELARQRAADAERLREQAEAQRAQAEAEKAKLRQDLLAQLSLVLETRDSARGLIVNMSDVLFDFNKYTLRPGAREKLAKISGIVLAHPGLSLEVEGHTDSVGTQQYNQVLSENRANAVLSYLVQQGVKPESITARGYGESIPVTDNAAAEGRQRNRRVELVVSGEIIGAKVESSGLR